MLTTSVFLILQSPIQIGPRKVCAKRKRGAAMATGGRPSKRVRLIPPTEVILAGSSRILKRLQTTGAPE